MRDGNHKFTVLSTWWPWICDISQFSWVAESGPTLCSRMDCSTPGFPVHHQPPEPAQTHVHQVSDAILPSHPLFVNLWLRQLQSKQLSLKCVKKICCPQRWEGRCRNICQEGLGGSLLTNVLYSFDCFLPGMTSGKGTHFFGHMS